MFIDSALVNGATLFVNQPELNFPEQGSSVSADTILVFNWNMANGATEFQLEVFENGNPNTILDKTIVAYDTIDGKTYDYSGHPYKIMYKRYSYTANENVFEAGKTYKWRVISINSFGNLKSDSEYFTFSISPTVGIEEKTNLIPENYKLHQNYPNPFNPNTNITYSLPEPGNVKIVVYNSLGQEVKTLVDKKQSTAITL